MISVRRLLAFGLLLVLPWAAEMAAQFTSPRRWALTGWLADCQAPDGSLRDRASGPDVIPYFANQAGLALLDTARGPSLARAYLNWYLSRLNRRDRYGLQGTVYDYHPGRPGPSDYDSADAYAATFLSLSRGYVERTGDWAWVRQHEPELTAVASLLMSLQDPDGLIRTGGPSVHRFLMDNAEDYRGLRDWAWLLAGLQQPEAARQARRRAELLAVAVSEVLWEPERSAYRWASPPWPPDPAQAAGYSPDWSRWYPDTAAQVFPSLFGVPQPGERRAISYRHLVTAFPRWFRGETGDRFPWLIIGLAALQAGDQDAVESLLQHAEAAFPAGEGWLSLGWHSQEAASELQLRTAVEAPAWGAAWRFLDGSY